MCFNYRMGFDPEPSKNPGDEFLIILTFDPSGMFRVTTLGGRPGYATLSSRSSPEHSKRGEAKSVNLRLTSIHPELHGRKQACSEAVEICKLMRARFLSIESGVQKKL